MLSLKSGIFIELNYISENFLSSVFSEFDISFYGKETYKFDVSVVYAEKSEIGPPPRYELIKKPINTTMTIKTKDEIGAFILVNLYTAYKISDFMYVGVGLKGSYSYRTAKTNEDAVYGDETTIKDIFYSPDKDVHYYPVIKEDEFKYPLSNNIRCLLYLGLMYIAK